MKKPPIGRTIATIIAALLIGAGVFLFVEASLINQDFEQKSKERPIDIAVDLSEPGEFSGEFRQTWRACHSQTINIHGQTIKILEEKQPFQHLKLMSG